jgi:hypothetical protein
VEGAAGSARVNGGGGAWGVGVWTLGLISGLLAPCSPGLPCDARSPWNKWRRGVVVLMGLGAVRTRGRRGLHPAGC